MASLRIPAKSLLLSLISSLVLSFPALALTFDGQVVSVHDGDTVTVKAKYGEIYKVRLLGIDAPELAQGEWGLKSRDYLTSLVLDKYVVIDTDPHAGEYDKYHRLLGYIHLKDSNILVNADMLKEGYAFKFKYERLVSEAELINSESVAKSASIGVWSATDLQNPSEYRKAHKH